MLGRLIGRAGDREGGGWRARARAAALMYASGGALAGLSMLPAQPPAVDRLGILAVSGLALVTAIGILATGRRYSIGLSHITSAAGTAIIASAIWMAGGSYLSTLYPIFYIWVTLFSVFFYGTRGALVHATLCSAAVVFGLSALPPSERTLTWALITATLYIVVACYAFMRRYTRRLHGLVEHSGAVVAVVTRDLTLAYHSASAQRVLGYGAGELVNRNLLEIVHRDDRARVRGLVTEVLANGPPTTVLECRMRAKDGAWLDTECDVQNLLSDPSIEGVVFSVRDITERRRLQEQLAYQAFHDPLTGLANRALFTDRVTHTLQRRAAAAHVRPGVLLLDVDDFKSVNDTMGHGAGDALLVAVADRLRRSLRAADTLARLGGDEFAVLVESCDGEDQLAEIAGRLLEDVRLPVMIDDGEVVVTLSIGGALPCTGLEDVDDLLRDADAAMYLAKFRGKGRYETFTPGMSEELVRRAQLKSDLRRAVSSAELHLVYQPTIDLATEGVRGVEALLRWDHPVLGPISPVEFIPLAEESGAIVDIGRWVLHEACAQAARWNIANPSWPALLMSVNVSVRQLKDDAFVDEVETALGSSGLDPANLVLEVTESVLVDEPATAAERLQRLKATGVTIALDDFGTGYSTLSYLRSLPVDLIKVDKSFIDDLLSPARTRQDFVQAIVGLIHSLDLPTVAEGIECEEQAQRLQQLHCEYGQGFLYAAPLSADAAEAWISATLRGPEAGGREGLAELAPGARPWR